MNNYIIKVTLVDDHVLLRNGLARLVDSFDGFRVIFEANNGEDLQNKIKAHEIPDFILLDINMPKMDGYDTTKWLRNTYPLVKILALSMYDNENSVIRMFQAGVNGYILKDCEPNELKYAIDSILTTGYYYSEYVTGKFIHSINQTENTAEIKLFSRLTNKETQFLKLVCTELTYKEIADKMFLSPRTIDGYRDSLFEKLHLKTRIGLVLFALRNGITHL